MKMMMKWMMNGMNVMILMKIINKFLELIAINICSEKTLIKTMNQKKNLLI